MNLTKLVQAPPRTYLPTEYQDALSKRWGDQNGYYGATGGWIYAGPSQAYVNTHPCPTVCQGWGSFWHSFKGKILDDLTRELTASESFHAFTHPQSKTYRPTLIVTGVKDWKTDALADAYDQAMEAQGDPRRAYRGSRDGMTPALVEDAASRARVRRWERERAAWDAARRQREGRGTYVK